MQRFTSNALIIPTLVALLGAVLYYYNPSSTLLAPLTSRQEWHTGPKASVQTSLTTTQTAPPILETPEVGQNVPHYSPNEGIHEDRGDGEMAETTPGTKHRVQGLPAPKEGDERGDLLSDGESVQLDKLGPIVVNQDGVGADVALVNFLLTCHAALQDALADSQLGSNVKNRTSNDHEEADETE
jgi:hypothetical protein